MLKQYSFTYKVNIFLLSIIVFVLLKTKNNQKILVTLHLLFKYITANTNFLSSFSSKLLPISFIFNLLASVASGKARPAKLRRFGLKNNS